MRNGKMDQERIAANREEAIAAGFRLFAERSIETVGMKEVAEASHLGIATLFRYFKTKLELVLEIGVKKWEEYAEYVRILRKVRNADGMTAAEELDFYLDFYLDLYEHHKDLLRFNQNFNSFVQHEGATKDQLRPYVMAISSLGSYMHGVYEKGKKDGTIRTDMTEDKMFATTSHIMMAVGVRYAQGLLYDADNEADRTEEFKMVKKMILREYEVN